MKYLRISHIVADKLNYAVTDITSIMLAIMEFIIKINKCINVLEIFSYLFEALIKHIFISLFNVVYLT